MKSLIFLLTAIFAALTPVALADPDKRNPVAAPISSSPTNPKVAAAGPPTMEVKNKSLFEMQGSNRNPFWPIGWKPAAKLADSGVEHGGPDIPLSAFVVSSITIENGTRFAIVNGKIMQEGQQFGLQLGNQTYQVTLKSIEDGRVVVARRDQEIVVPLRRR